MAEYDRNFFRNNGYSVEAVYEPPNCPHDNIRDACACRFLQVDFRLVKR
jgi:hypothetical protein